jgi:flagellar motor switch protein FliN/FliY
MAESEDTGTKKKGKEVSPLELDEIEGDGRAAKPSDEDDSWDEPPADIPDKPRSAQDLEAVYDIPVRVSAVLGKSSMQVNELLKLGRGAVVELDRKVGEAIDIYVNDRLVARGEVVVVDDRLGITMTEIIKTQKS